MHAFARILQWLGGILFEPGNKQLIYMAAKKTDPGPVPPDQTKVTLASSNHVEYWTYKLNCTADELRDAVESVGTDPQKIREYLYMVKGERGE